MVASRRRMTWSLFSRTTTASALVTASSFICCLCLISGGTCRDMGSNLANNSVYDWASSRCPEITLTGCNPRRPVFIPNTPIRTKIQRREGESAYGTSGFCSPGLASDRYGVCRRLPWDPEPSVPFYSDLILETRGHTSMRSNQSTTEKRSLSNRVLLCKAKPLDPGSWPSVDHEFQ